LFLFYKVLWYLDRYVHKRNIKPNYSLI
jgi:hypothetical protein